MKTNNIPALITLAAGAVYCIIGLTKDYDALTFVRELLIVLIVFFVIGILVKTIFDKSFKDFGDKDKVEETKEEDNSQEKDDITAGDNSDEE